MFNVRTGLDCSLCSALVAFVVMASAPVFAANNPVPFIDLPTVPSVAVPGGAGFTLTVNGAGFVSGSVVNWNGSPRTTTFVSAAQVTAAILASDIATASTARVTVSNPAPGGGVSGVAYFEVTTPVSSVTVAGLQVPGLANFNSPIVADLNNDGKLDLIVFLENQEGENPYVALGNGDGTFQPPVPIQGGLVEFPFVALADFNKDGNLDIALVTCCNVPSTISILLGKGDGTFQPPTFIGSQTNTVYNGVTIGDFNQDGNLDLITNFVVSDSNAGFSLLLGNGDGTFQSPINNPMPFGTGCGGASDYTGDGKLDLLCFSQTLIEVLPGNGDGTFQAAVTTPYQSFTGIDMTAGSVYDVNEDGKADLLFGYLQDHPLEFWSQILLGNGDGTFQTAYLSAFGIAAFPPGDFNGDGKLDFVSTTTESYPFPPDELSIWVGNGDGTFGNPVAIQTSTGLPLTPLVQSDFNGDGTQDLLAQDSKGGFWLFLQGSFLVGNASPTILNFASQTVSTASAAQVVTLRNTGSGTLTLSPISISGLNASQFKQVNTCAATLAVGASCQINVTFTPVGSGARSATLNVPNNGIGNRAVPLLGVGADFSMSAPIPGSVTVAAGQAANYTFAVEPQGGFTGSVSLSCDGAPVGAKCTLPASITLNGLSDITVAVSVTTAAHAMAMKQYPLPRGGRWLACGVFGLPLIVSLAGAGGRRHRARVVRLTFLLLMTIAMLLLPACGGGNGGSGGNGSGTPAGTYPLTVAGKYTSGGETLTHTVTLTLVVE